MTTTATATATPTAAQTTAEQKQMIVSIENDLSKNDADLVVAALGKYGELFEQCGDSVEDRVQLLQKFGLCGSSQRILRAMKNFEGNVDVELWCLVALAQMFYHGEIDSPIHDECKDYFRLNNGFATVLSAMERQVVHTQVERRTNIQRWGSQALNNIMVDHADNIAHLQQQLGNNNKVIAVITNAMKVNQDDLETQQNGCRILESLDTARATAEAMVQADDTLRMVTGALSQYPDDDIIQTNATQILKKISEELKHILDHTE